MPRGRRAAAWAIDFVLLIVVGVGLTVATASRIQDEVSVDGTVRAGFWSVIKSGGHVTGAQIVADKWDTIVGFVVEGFVALAVVAFAYQWLAVRLAGRSVGKAVMDIRVVGADGGRVPAKRAAARAAVSSAIDVGLFAIACVLLIHGDFAVAGFAWLVAVGVFWLNAALAQYGARLSLADRAAGTRVESGQAYAIAADLTARGVRSAQRRAQEAAASEAAQKARAAAAASGQRAAAAGSAGAGVVRAHANRETAERAGAAAGKASRRLARLGAAGAKRGAAGAAKAAEAYREGRRTLTVTSTPLIEEPMTSASPETVVGEGGN